MLLVGVFVLLVHNHKTEVAERKKDGGADAENNVIVCFRQLLLPDFHPFGIGELGCRRSVICAVRAISGRR